MNVGGHGRPYTEAEDFLILDTPHLTAEQVARMLGRTAKSVQKRRGQLRGREGITTYHIPGLAKGRQHAFPWIIGSRRLIAKTCLHCGGLLNASHYDRYKTARWHESCRGCEARRIRPSSWHTADSEAKRARERVLQAITVERATRNRVAYTEADITIFADPTKSVFQMAIETGRTLHAVRNARKRYGLADQVPVPDENADDSRWIIRFPMQEGVAA